ncbi:hypothetical protein TNCV_2333971 [Trichonephila clavipes]|nr:hypothetical protein TNCV_2333971 [Trichonephila clavipes]
MSTGSRSTHCSGQQLLTRKNPEGSELAKNGSQHDRQVSKMVTKVANLVSKYDANLALSPRFRQVPIDSPL